MRKKNKLLLIIFLIVMLFTSCSMQSDFVCYLSETDMYVTVSKRAGGICYVMFTDRPGVALLSDSIDYIKTRNNDILNIVYDSSNIKDLNIQCGLGAISNQVKYNIHLYLPVDWELFDDAFREERILSAHQSIRKEYKYLHIDMLHFTVTLNNEVIREGDVLGGW